MTTQRIWPATDGPNTSNDDGQAINVGTEFVVSTPAWVTALRWYRGTTSVNPDSLRLYQITSPSTGTMLAEVVSPVATGTGWHESPITPVAISAVTRYKSVAHMPNHYTATGGYWAGGGPGAGGIVNGFLTAPNTGNAEGGGQGTFRYGVVAFPDGTFNGGNYWVDVVVTDVDPTGTIIVDVGQAVELNSADAISVTRSYPVEQAVSIDSANAIQADIVTATITPLRKRVSGTEPQRIIAGNEPPFRVSGNEVGAP